MAAVVGDPRSTPALGRAGGFSDLLPGAAGRRRDLIEAFVGAFESWGYGLLGTPLVEPLDRLAAGIGAARQSQLCRFTDADAALLALVGERTVSVARVVATQLQREQLPLRLCYAGPVLRNAPLLDGRRREAIQAGCELIGHAGLSGDAECIALAAAALERGGVRGVQIDVGHADFIPGVLESAGLDADAQRIVLGALARRDLVAVEAALERTDVRDAERRLLLAFPTLRGGREILDTAAIGRASGCVEQRPACNGVEPRQATARTWCRSRLRPRSHRPSRNGCACAGMQRRCALDCARRAWSGVY